MNLKFHMIVTNHFLYSYILQEDLEPFECW